MDFVVSGKFFLVAEKISFNFNIINKSCKYYIMTFIGEIGWLMSLDKEAIVLWFITLASSSCDMLWLHWLIKWVESRTFPISPPISYLTILLILIGLALLGIYQFCDFTFGGGSKFCC